MTLFLKKAMSQHGFPCAESAFALVFFFFLIYTSTWFSTDRGSAAVRSLTGVGRVAGGSVEEVGRGAQGGHAGVTVAVHARGNGAVAALLRGGAGDIAVGGDAARAPTET